MLASIIAVIYEITVTDGKTTDIEVVRSLGLNKGSIIIGDRRYPDYG
jgi:hypothetical protein